jgi:prohibitin 1
VDGGERALVFDRYRGVLPKPVGEGTHFVVPILQYPILMDIRTTPLEFASLTGSKGMSLVVRGAS